MKRILSIILSVCMMSAATTVIAQENNIINSDWADAEIAEANQLGIIPENFAVTDYTQPITRENFCNIAVGMIEAKNVVLETENAERPLSVADTENINVTKLYKAGIILGKDETETGIIFAPNDLITREEAATILNRMAVYMGIKTPDTTENTLYSDEEAMSDWAVDAVKILWQMGVMNGVDDFYFAPKDTYTTEQSVATMVRLFNYTPPVEYYAMSLLLPENITEIEYSGLDDTNKIKASAAVYDELVKLFSAIIATEQVKEKSLNGYSLTIVSEEDSAVMSVYDNGVVTINSGDSEIQYVLQNIEDYEHIANVLNKKFYEYETPLGTLKSMTYYGSWVNFAIESNATVGLIKDRSNYSDNHFMIDIPIKAFTNQTSTQYMSFSGFAQILGGEWKLNETEVLTADGEIKYEYNFEFTYDASKEIAVQKYEENNTGEEKEWPNKTDAADVMIFTDIDTVTINGEEKEILAQYGGKVFNSHIIMYNGELYLPVQMLAEVMGYETAGLDIIFE